MLTAEVKTSISVSPHTRLAQGRSPEGGLSGKSYTRRSHMTEAKRGPQGSVSALRWLEWLSIKVCPFPASSQDPWALLTGPILGGDIGWQTQDQVYLGPLRATSDSWAAGQEPSPLCPPPQLTPPGWPPGGSPHKLPEGSLALGTVPSKCASSCSQQNWLLDVYRVCVKPNCFIYFHICWHLSGQACLHRHIHR